MVISPDRFNTLCQDAVVAAITSQISLDPDAVNLANFDCAEGALPKPSMVKIAKLFTIHASLIEKRVCRLNREKTDEILSRIREFFS